MGVGFFEGGGEFTRSWPATSSGAILPVGGQRHAREIAAYLPSPHITATPALIAETRRQLGGCMATVEAALLIGVGTDPEGLGGHAWRMLQYRPELLSHSLFGHMRARAALVLMARSVREKPLGGEGQASDLRLSLRLAQSRWAETKDANAPIVTDLPADIYVELVWLTAAFLVDVLDGEAEQTTLTLAAAAQRLFDRHDEAAAPVAMAERLAMLDDVDAGGALASGDHLLFLALVARQCNLSFSALLNVLSDVEPDQWLALCRSSGCSWSDAAAWLGAMTKIRSDIDLEMRAALAHRYEALDAEAIATTLAPLRVAAPLADLLTRLAGAAE